jgi:ribosomal protein S18 acetylase RimI-like enzyme
MALDELEVIVDAATLADAEAILALQLLCFESEGALTGDYSIAPLTQTIEGMRQDIREKTVLALRVGGRVMGSVRAHLDGGTCEIGRLMVHPDLQGRRLGIRLMAAIEEEFAPQVTRYALFTGHLSVRNLSLYNKLGYREYKRARHSELLEVVFLEKLKAEAAGA